MIRVILESPYQGAVDRNVRYLRACLRDCLLKGEAPFASHGLYTLPGVLHDDIPDERQRGMEAGWAWIAGATKVVVYTDFGISEGMEAGISRARDAHLTLEYRQLPMDVVRAVMEAS